MSGKKRETKADRHLRKLIEGAGGTVETRPNNHLCIRFPGARPVFHSRTGSDHRGGKNLRSQIRRAAGVDIPELGAIR